VRPVRLVVRQTISGTPQYDRARETAALKEEMAALLEDSTVEVPDSPAAALLRECALLSAMMRRPFDDTSRVVIVRPMDMMDAPHAAVLIGILQLGLKHMWGCDVTELAATVSSKDPPSSAPPPGLWCTGWNLGLLLPLGRHQVLLRRSDGTMGLLELYMDTALDLEDARARQTLPAPHAADTQRAELLQTLHAGHGCVDHRSGLVISADPSPEEARAMLLSILSLPEEFAL